MISRGLSTQTELLLSDSSIKSRVLWEIIGPLGFIFSEGLTPFNRGAKALTEMELKDICHATVRVVNRRLLSLYYERQQSSQLLISKITTLVYDGLIPKIGKSVERYIKEHVDENQRY